MNKTPAGRDGQNVLLIHDRLRSSILRGSLAPGQVTSQLELARDLGVGRTPLREALRLLQREGLVVQEPNRRVRIAELSVSDAEEIYTLRITLEAMAMRLTIPLLTSEDFAELEGLYAQIEHYIRTQDIERMDAPHRAFHLRFVRAAGPRWLEEIAQLYDHAERYRLSFFRARPEGGQLRQAEHRAMLDAAIRYDVEAAIECMARHYTHTALVAFAQLEPGYVPEKLNTVLDMLCRKTPST
ncbi:MULTISPECIES: GntR family transcriptional regulator [unclassified Meiothermus]|uniref:GntR family transcriptional regulator n=1 Tax=unclassified Meiothermus TaxID=370471 RepID=UPI000D7BDC33|nr:MULTISPECIES: GntR family transcriptional regulator [unclassified Meiothermus]PZA07689.1 GntR family transcriptional regulator [Meiothermus sp. Pnk-1]RYM34499.1 GntR family transcriptional regulator [Meiothermus sp. PNK-Is4]